MSQSQHPLPIDAVLDPCGCCEDLPMGDRANRPGLPAIQYRLGTYGTFLEQLLAQLSRPVLPDGPTLEALKIRDLDDGAIALLDAWAVVADVLTFYQERIANENYLRTATERRSLLELARAIGYELNPGVAASTYLAFTVEGAANPEQRAIVPAGTQIQSIPEQDQLPQTFETSAEITARAAWNALHPPQTRPSIPAVGDYELYLAGITTRLGPGDWLLLVGDERQADADSDRWEVRRLLTVEADPKANRTYVAWAATAPLSDRLPENPRVYAFRTRANIYGYNAQDWRSLPNVAKATYLEFDDPENATLSAEQKAEWPVYTICAPASGTRHPLPSLAAAPAIAFEVAADPCAIDLDTIYPELTPGSWVLLSYLTHQALYHIDTTLEAARSDFGLTGKTTRLTFSGSPNLEESEFATAVRGTLVYGASEVLALAEMPLSAPIAGHQLEIAERVTDLLPGVAIAVSGKVMAAQVSPFARDLVLTAVADSPTEESSRAIAAGTRLWVEALPEPLGSLTRWTLRDGTGFVGTVAATPDQITYAPALEDDDTVREIAFLATLPTVDTTTHLVLASPLQFVYDRATVTLNANVAPATHGETVATVLGSGDGAQAHQTFPLKKPPLTYVSASTPSGNLTTLAVRVNRVLWSETRGFYGVAPTAEQYIVRIADDGTPQVIFGDGRQGARLPTGTENVTATYRSGIGLAGEVAAGSLTLLKQRPLGVRSVVNPIAATGAEDPETLETARSNAPLTVLTLDRIVSRQDYGDFAQAFAGIGKAQAVPIWDGFTERVHLTIAGANGEPVAEDSMTYLDLKAAIADLRDPGPPFLMASFDSRRFQLQATLWQDPRYQADAMEQAATTALLETFAFHQRDFGQGVSAAEVIALLQAVDGVIAVDLDRLHRSDRPPQLEPYLVAEIARWDATAQRIARGELLLIDPAGIQLEVKVP